MNELIADKWVKALRSGEYSQAIGKLQTYAGFCCLGVLCKVGELEGVYVVMRGGTKQIHGEDLYAQSDVKEWSGIKTGIGVAEVLGNNCLTGLNDGGELNFSQIADLIEEHWNEL